MYYKELFIFHEKKPVHAIIRNYQPADFDALIALQSRCFPPPFPESLWWNKHQLRSHLTHFPEGAICIEVNGEIVSSMTTLLVNHAAHGFSANWATVTDNGYIRTHNPNGDFLYVVDISVDPSYRGCGLGKWMMHAMYELVIQQHLRGLIGGSRMPGYSKFAHTLSPTSYLEKVMIGELYDPVVSFLLKCGRRPTAILENYLEDEESLHYGVLMEWQNPFIPSNLKEEV